MSFNIANFPPHLRYGLNVGFTEYHSHGEADIAPLT